MAFYKLKKTLENGLMERTVQVVLVKNNFSLVLLLSFVAKGYNNKCCFNFEYWYDVQWKIFHVLTIIAI